MSGPWPESGKTIPQKFDQSPAQAPLPGFMGVRTPVSGSGSGLVSGSGGGNGVGVGMMQPNLAPSPVQVAQGERGSVPVKKELEAVPGSNGQTQE
jgi:hypothetical protein